MESIDVVNDGSRDLFDSLRIDEKPETVELVYPVRLGGFLDELHGIFVSRATARDDAHTEAVALEALVVEDFYYAIDRARSEFDQWVIHVL